MLVVLLYTFETSLEDLNVDQSRAACSQRSVVLVLSLV